jgi:hypothetical protein
MNREDITRMARKAGAMFDHITWVERDLFPVFARFAELVAAHEREACVAIVLDNSDAEGICCTDDVLEAFRQRGET